MRKGIYGSIVLLAFLLTPQTAAGQEGVSRSGADTPQDFWVNLESSPLVFEINESRRVLFLTNSGPKRVSGYRLGCASLIQGKRTIRHKMGLNRTDLVPNHGLLNGVSVYWDAAARCERLQAKLAVVEVRFSDGSRWKAK